MDTRELRDVARTVSFFSDGDAETIKDAADRIDELEAFLKGATVVEIPAFTECPFCDGDLSYCNINKNDYKCPYVSFSFSFEKIYCPLSKGAVIVKMMKKEN